MPRDIRAYLVDIVEACDAIADAMEEINESSLYRWGKLLTIPPAAKYGNAQKLIYIPRLSCQTERHALYYV